MDYFNNDRRKLWLGAKSVMSITIPMTTHTGMASTSALIAATQLRTMMKNNTAKKFGRRKARTWGRTAGAYAKRVASKALRRWKPQGDE